MKQRAILMLAAGLLAALSSYAAEPANEVNLWQQLTTAMASSVTQGWRQTQTDASIIGQPLSIAGRRYEKGLGTHAPGDIVFKLNRRNKKFIADVGVDDHGDKTGSVVFKVLLDGKAAFESGLMKWGEPARHVALDVTGVSELKLAVSDGGDGVRGDHADWANAAVDDAVLAKPQPRFSTAGFFAMPGSPRTVLNFNPGWRFLKADAPGAEKPGFDDSAWEAANLPHSLEILGENASGCRNYQGPAWYRKRFQAAPAGRDLRDLGGRIHQPGRAHGEQHVAAVRRLDGGLEGPLGQRLAEPHHPGSHRGGAAPAAGRRKPTALSGANPRSRAVRGSGRRALPGRKSRTKTRAVITPASPNSPGRLAWGVAWRKEGGMIGGAELGLELDRP
jgi:hypothetical protein